MKTKVPSTPTVQLCWCGAPVVNGHHCEEGHLQNRVTPAPAPRAAGVVFLLAALTLAGCSSAPPIGDKVCMLRSCVGSTCFVHVIEPCELMRVEEGAE